MTGAWFKEFIQLFRPEDSSCFYNENYSNVSSFQSLSKKSPVSVKALVWIVLSIAAGLALGQLH